MSSNGNSTNVLTEKLRFYINCMLPYHQTVHSTNVLTEELRFDINWILPCHQTVHSN